MSRTSAIGRLQRGQAPLPARISRAHARQKVWPQGIKAAPFPRPIHTQHHHHLSTPLEPSPSPPSSSSSNFISDDALSPSSLPPEARSLPVAAAAARFRRSAASAVARSTSPAASAAASVRSGSIGRSWPSSVARKPQSLAQQPMSAICRCRRFHFRGRCLPIRRPPSSISPDLF